MSVSINNIVLNSEFQFTVDTSIDCETNMIFKLSGFTSQINYTIGSTTSKNQLAVIDSKSIQTNIKGACGPIFITLNSTDILSNEIKPLPNFIKFECDEIQIKTGDSNLAGIYSLQINAGL